MANDLDPATRSNLHRVANDLSLDPADLSVLVQRAD
jgi:hypothetical protein